MHGLSVERIHSHLPPERAGLWFESHAAQRNVRLRPIATYSVQSSLFGAQLQRDVFSNSFKKLFPMYVRMYVCKYVYMYVNILLGSLKCGYMYMYAFLSSCQYLNISISVYLLVSQAINRKSIYPTYCIRVQETTFRTSLRMCNLRFLLHL